MVLVSRAFASGFPVAGSASLLTNFKMQEKDGVTFSPSASLVNETYTMPAELAERVGTGMIKSSVSPESAAGCIIMETHSKIASGIFLQNQNAESGLDEAKVEAFRIQMSLCL